MDSSSFCQREYLQQEEFASWKLFLWLFFGAADHGEQWTDDFDLYG